ncbi:MAG TPA: flagellar biosynthesis protein FliQ [Alphaproteobacteria bacterium]|jgi:flagellar biosynthetic protein FliQ|nr:flagellar biosynthesis protein FliQ [Alphaproteobacteria bacterium]
MNSSDVIDIARDTIFVTLQVGGPILLIALVVGLIISLFQALTQIQEMTLSFVPKILIIFLSVLLFMPFMLSTMTAFTERMADRIVGLG